MVFVESHFNFPPKPFWLDFFHEGFTGHFCSRWMVFSTELSSFYFCIGIVVDRMKSSKSALYIISSLYSYSLSPEKARWIFSINVSVDRVLKLHILQMLTVVHSLGTMIVVKIWKLQILKKISKHFPLQNYALNSSNEGIFRQFFCVRIHLVKIFFRFYFSHRKTHRPKDPETASV